MVLRSAAKSQITYVLVRGWARQESNLRPSDYESPALTIELRARGWNLAAAANDEGPAMFARALSHLMLLVDAPGVGLEPTTNGLTVRRSTN